MKDNWGQKVDKMNLPEWMIYQSFRYCLGRKTYAVSKWVDWAIENWDDIPEHTQGLIKREVQEAFEQYKRGQYLILGLEMDKQQWKRILDI